MSFWQFFHVLRGRIRLVIVMFILVTGAVITLTFFMPKMYKAQTAVILNYKGADPVTGNPIPEQSLPGQLAILIATQIDIIKSDAVAKSVVDQLNLVNAPEMKDGDTAAEVAGNGSLRDGIAQRLLRRVNVEPSRESNVFRITYSDADPIRAALIANAFASSYQQISVKLNVEPSKLAANYFNTQLSELRNRVERANEKVSRYQQESGIVSATGVDYETVRLNELAMQLVTAQSQVLEATSRSNHAVGNAGVSPDVEANPLIRRLKMELSAAEQKLAGLAAKVTPEHPQYQTTADEIVKLSGMLNAQMGKASKVIGNNAQVLREKEAELQGALTAQKEKVLKLNSQRDELNILRQEAESMQRAYDTAANRLMANNFAGQANLSEVSILSAAVPPSKPFTPKVLLNIALSVVLGSVFGVGTAIARELLDRRARSVQDLVDLLSAPVLGVMPRPIAANKHHLLPMLRQG